MTGGRRSRLWQFFGISVVTMGLSVTSSLAMGGQAEAAVGSCNSRPDIAYQRAKWCGYFLNNQDTNGTHVFDNGIPGYVNTAAEFINLINNYRLNGDTQHKTGARFIILTMLGAPGGTAPTQANTRYAEWVKLVNDYAASGLINWNYAHPFYCNILNSYYQENFPDDAFYTEPASAGRCGSSVTRASIIFRHPVTNQIVYALKRDCANPIGEIRALPPVAYDLAGSLTPGAGTPPFNGIIQPGLTYRLTPSVRNPSQVRSDPFVLEVGNLTPAYISYSGALSPGGYDTAAPGYSTSCAPGVANCWHWIYGAGLPAGVTSTQTSGALFTVSNATPDGKLVCFNLTVNPARNDGTRETSGASCFTVYRPHYPGIIGTSGDVHAGGGLCAQAQANGSINTHALSNSIGEYVVSASGIVSNFGSDNAAGGSSATLGKTGNYATICRPDLVALARSYINAGGAYRPLGNGGWNVGALPASASGVYVHNAGGNITLRGTYSGNRPITIVSLGGTVTISNPIILNALATTGDNVPSIGIIAAGGIEVAGAANRVDAYLFSNGTIDTCSEGNVAACRNTLTVNGFLMGRRILFKRLGPATGATATVGERINLTGQLYLNPPKFFDSASIINLLQHQGERPPLN